MKIKNYVAIMGCLALTMSVFSAKAQTKAVLFDGTLVAGYVDDGAFINCTGPSIKFSKKPYTVLLGLLPSLRIKEDKVAAGAPKNKMLTPNLGFGLTAAFKHVAVQMPLYYNPKTAAKNGEWNVGVGLGYKF
ncbi:hypothetical protein ACS5PU_06535 [Pedobacter sp. GSP4]|uniref:hypothetical protein n=1 Tax=Pedobacter sp. GSP4 TaxID=3453716 RepID=UPI003EECD91E